MLNARKIELLRHLKAGSYPFPRGEQLAIALDRCAEHYFAGLAGGKEYEARGLLVTGRSRVGKTHELAKAISRFNEAGYALPGGKPAQILTRKLWENESWKDLARGVLAELDIPLHPRDNGTKAWGLVVDQARRQGVVGLCIDEAQHAFSATGRAKNKSVLDSFKAVLKDRKWPMMLILSGVPELASYIEIDEKGEERRQLRHLLTPIHFNMIELPHDFVELRDLMFAYARKGEVEAAEIASQDFFERLAFVSDNRWGLAIELIIEAIATSKCSDNSTLELQDFAEAYAAISGTYSDYSPFFIQDYRRAFDPQKMSVFIDRNR